MATVLYSTPIPSNTQTYTFSRRPSGGGAPTGRASMSVSMDAGGFGGGGGGSGGGYGGNIPVGSNTSAFDALALAKQQGQNDSERMEQAFKYRDKEATRDFGFREKESFRDFDFRTKGADQDSALRKSEAWQQQEFRTANANQDSGLRMKEADQQYGFNRMLQFENNDAKERMQRWGLDHETNMFKLRDEAQSRSMRTAALRAARAFQGKIPTNV